MALFGLAGWAGDCPYAEVVNNVTDVYANAIESLTYARRLNMKTLLLPNGTLLTLKLRLNKFEFTS
jgi:hypothetical protein